MRHLVWVLTLLLVPAMAAAQSSALDRGSLQLEGDASFVSAGMDGNDERTTSLFLRPGIKYFVLPRLAVGGEVVVGYSSQGEVDRTSLGVGPAVDYYFGGLGGALHPFVSAAAFLGRDRTDRPTGEVVVRRHQLRGAAGLLYLLSEQVGVTGALFYQTSDSESDDVSSGQDVYGLTFGVAAFVF